MSCKLRPLAVVPTVLAVLGLAVTLALVSGAVPASAQGGGAPPPPPPSPPPGPIAEVGFSVPELTAREGGLVALNVELFDQDGNELIATQTVRVTAEFSDGRPSEMVTIDQGQTSADFTFTAPADDAANVAPPDLVVTLAMPTNAMLSDSTRARIKVTDDDPLAVLGFATSVLRVTEGAPVRIRLELANGVVATRTIRHPEHLRFGTTLAGTEQRDFPTVPMRFAIDWGEIPQGGTSTLVTLTAGSDDLAGTAPDDVVYALAHLSSLVPDTVIGFVTVDAATNKLTVRHVDDDVALVGFVDNPDQMAIYQL